VGTEEVVTTEPHAENVFGAGDTAGA
jgi:hypothetical protein